MPQFCGLCKKEVDDWEKHTKSEEHQKNLADPTKVLEVYAESQAKIVTAIKAREEEGKK